MTAYLIEADHREVSSGHYHHVGLTVPLADGSVSIAGAIYPVDDSTSIQITLHGPRGGYWGTEGFDRDQADAIAHAMRVSGEVRGRWGAFFTEPEAVGLRSVRGRERWLLASPRERVHLAFALSLVVADLDTAIAEAGAR